MTEQDRPERHAALPGLRAAWRKLLPGVGADPVAGERVFTELAEAYGQPGRSYHNLDHVSSVLAEVEAQARRARDPAALRFAAWFHDAVYDPRAADNEERSATWAERVLGEMGVTRPTAEAVRRLILLTKSHRAGPDDADGHILLDADLAVLGAPVAEYRAYSRAIRQEYAWVPEDAYRAGRGRVLRSFLARERIYLTPAAMAALEGPARRNLEAELRELEQGG
jgi:predicted metal-dependent HD superfamily phosphohydrolase